MARLDLPNGQWLDVKDDVKVKDRRDAYEYSGLEMQQSADGGVGRRLHAGTLQKHQVSMAAIWIADWSLLADGAAVVWPGARATFKNRVSALEELPGRIFDLVTEAVTNYENAKTAAEEAAKNATPAGAIA
jgi:hypothetical protein